MFKLHCTNYHMLHLLYKDSLGWSPVASINSPKIKGHENDANFILSKLACVFANKIPFHNLGVNDLSFKEDKRIMKVASSILPLDKEFESLADIQLYCWENPMLTK